MVRECDYSSFRWASSNAGISDQVSQPWTPLVVAVDQSADRVRGQSFSVSCWGREYEFREDPFLSQVKTAGERILANPLRLVARSKDGPIVWQDFQLKICEQTPSRVRLSQTARSDSLLFSNEICIEFDGVSRFDWSLEATRELCLEELALEIRLKGSFAKYLYYFPSDCAEKVSNAGYLPPGGYEGGFRPYVWLGDEQRGLGWFCESDEGWSADADNVTTISRDGEQVVLRLCIISRPTEMTRSFLQSRSNSEATSIHSTSRLRYTFGLQATPVKPVREDVWDYRITHVEATYYGIKRGLKLPDATLDQLAEAGVRTIAVHEHWTDIQSYVTTNHGDELRELVKACHSRGMQVLLYFGFLISDLAPEWPVLGDECVVMPRGGYEPYDYPPQPRQNAYRVCYNSVWQDRLAHGIAEAMDEYDVDGVFLDGTEYVWHCSNRRHGCGYVRPDESLAPTYPIWAVRSMMKRIYNIVRSRKPYAQINVHNSNCMVMPTLGWATSYWDGEQLRDFPPRSSATEVLSLDAFRTEFMGCQWGVAAEFLGYEQEDGKVFGYQQAYAFTLLHDVLVRSWRIGPSLALASALWRLSDEFRRKEAEWLPYWRNAEYVSIQPEGVYASLYRHSDTGILMVISNLGREEVTAQVRLNLEKLGLTNELSACDALTREEIAADSGTFTLALKSLGWKIIWAS
jgi:hypothetical protein